MTIITSHGREPFLVHTVKAEEEGRTLYQLLRGTLGVSRTLLRRARRSGGLRVNGAEAYQRQTLSAGDLVEIYFPEGEGVEAEAMDLHILYEDEDLLALNKPPGLVVHPTLAHPRGTLLNGVTAYFVENGVPLPARPVHRLDRDTSGAILFAKNPWVQYNLMPPEGPGRIERTYLAVADGVIREDEGLISAAVSREGAAGGRRRVGEEGRPAVTSYRVLRRFPSGTVLQVRLLTGRTHQIRAHLAHLGHPLFGDATYGEGKGPIGRQALHAERIKFVHPRGGGKVVIEAPVPEDIRELIDTLEREGEV